MNIIDSMQSVYATLVGPEMVGEDCPPVKALGFLRAKFQIEQTTDDSRMSRKAKLSLFVIIEKEPMTVMALQGIEWAPTATKKRPNETPTSGICRLDEVTPVFPLGINILQEADPRGSWLEVCLWAQFEVLRRIRNGQGRNGSWSNSAAPKAEAAFA